jgi:hypothetical protein
MADGPEALGQAQRERVFHIDFRAEFIGHVTRADLMARFGLREAAATRDLAAYRALAPANLLYDPVSRVYRRAPAFRPVFAHDPAQALSALADGFGDDAVVLPGAYVRTERPLRLNQPDIAVLGAVSRCIVGERLLRIAYRSLSSGLTERVIAPFALVDSGIRWHVRAWDRLRGRFGDFVLTRIVSATEMAEAPQPGETWEEDDQWTHRVVLELVPHPGLAHPDAVARDYAMQDGVLPLRLRAAVAGYVLRHFSVDITPDHRLPAERHQLWLRNGPALGDVSNLLLASEG